MRQLVHTFVGALFQLLVVSGLLDEVQYVNHQLRVGKRVRLWVDCFCGLDTTCTQTNED